MLRKALIAGSIAAAVPMAVSAEPYSSDHVIKIGLVDVAATKFINCDKNASIEYRAFNSPGTASGLWPMKFDNDHGVVMASTVLDQIRSMDRNVKVKIFAANVMEFTKDGGSLKLSPSGSLKALDWFSQNDVKVVLTTFVGHDSQMMRDFVGEAKRRNMIVLASSGNNVAAGKKSYPAAYPDVISVVGPDARISLARGEVVGDESIIQNDSSVAAWTNFAVDGKILIHDYESGAQFESVGSSMSTARAAGIAAYAVSLGKASDVAGVKDVFSRLSQAVKSTSLHAHVNVPYVEHANVGNAVRSIAPYTEMPSLSQSSGVKPNIHVINQVRVGAASLASNALTR